MQLKDMEKIYRRRIILIQWNVYRNPQIRVNSSITRKRHKKRLSRREDKERARKRKMISALQINKSEIKLNKKETVSNTFQLWIHLGKLTSAGMFLINVPDEAGDREENRGTLTLPFDSARSRSDIVVTILTLSFVCASEACMIQE